MRQAALTLLQQPQQPDELNCFAESCVLISISSNNERTTAPNNDATADSTNTSNA